MWIDTHCHLDAHELVSQLPNLPEQMAQVHVRQLILPSIYPPHFAQVQKLAKQYGFAYALGIHPLYVESVGEDALVELDTWLSLSCDDPNLVAVGEIGLDFFVDNQQVNYDKQLFFYEKQLQLAKKYALPVLLHVRRSQDQILKYLRKNKTLSGIAHAFNGSFVQAQQFMDLGYKLGFGGALTFPRARQIRRLAQTLPLESIVLETDSPDMAPYWLVLANRERSECLPNTPLELPAIAAQLAVLREVSLPQLSAQLYQNTIAVIPKLSYLI